MERLARPGSTGRALAGINSTRRMSMLICVFQVRQWTRATRSGRRVRGFAPQAERPGSHFIHVCTTRKLQLITCGERCAVCLPFSVAVRRSGAARPAFDLERKVPEAQAAAPPLHQGGRGSAFGQGAEDLVLGAEDLDVHVRGDRKSTRLNSSHLVISYAVFCLKQ